MTTNTVAIAKYHHYVLLYININHYTHFFIFIVYVGPNKGKLTDSDRAYIRPFDKKSRTENPDGTPKSRWDALVDLPWTREVQSDLPFAPCPRF